MAERFCTVGDVELCFETFGSEADPALLLVMGLATQMIAWHEEFCGDLAARGFHVIRFDNRDVGRSTRMTGRPPSVAQLIRRSRAAARYSLDDMADDAAGLLDHLGVEAAHVVGASMGGMIGQQLAVRSPERVLSLVSMMSTTGNRRVGQASPRLYPVLLRRAPDDPDRYAEHILRVYRMIGSPGYPRDEAELRALAGRSYERGYNPAGAGRQLGAIVAAGDRTPQLRTIRAPTLVIHGEADRLIPVSGGRATARAIPGARLLTIPGMGHDLPRQLWPRLIDAIEAHARQADSRATGAAVA